MTLPVVGPITKEYQETFIYMDFISVISIKTAFDCALKQPFKVTSLIDPENVIIFSLDHLL